MVAVFGPEDRDRIRDLVDRHLTNQIVVGTLAATLATLLILVRRLDLLRWQERVTIWEPAERLFRSMDRDPYVPRLVIDAGRFRPTGRVRVVDYPDPYPIRTTKRITVEESGGEVLDIRPPTGRPGLDRNRYQL